MKSIAYALAAITTIAFAAPASAKTVIVKHGHGHHMGHHHGGKTVIIKHGHGHHMGHHGGKTVIVKKHR